MEPTTKTAAGCAEGNAMTPLQDDDFRQHVATVDQKGKRVWVYPRKPSGRYHKARIIVTAALLALLLTGPFLKVNGQPLLLLNVFERKFVIFGQAFWPQDFFFLALALIAFFVFIIMFTVVFGRIWCGWLCPQTIFMEMVFRKIEYAIEGDMAAQRRLANGPWNFTKVRKKALKHFIFVIIAVIIAHTLIAYMVGVDETLAIVKQSPSEHPAGFIGMVGFTGLFYWLFAFFREQACTAVCPYGRLQGVLLGKESIVVAYDWLRGEPRSFRRKERQSNDHGDCIDCKLCVQVCPTGIDIRNGTQLECVNCTACIDACDDVMLKIGQPRGLIRFASVNSISRRAAKVWTPRVTGYSMVLLLLLTLLTTALATRSDVEATILKVPGTLYQREPGFITNLYNAEFINKTLDDVSVELRAESPDGAVVQEVGGKSLIIPAGGVTHIVLFIKIAEDKVTKVRTTVTVGVYKDAKRMESVNVKFIGPVSTVNH